VDCLAAGEAIGVGGRGSDVVGPRVERERGVDVEVAEEGSSKRVAVGAGLARIDVRRGGARGRVAAAGGGEREEDDDRSGGGSCGWRAAVTRC